MGHSVWWPTTKMSASSTRLWFMERIQYMVSEFQILWLNYHFLLWAVEWRDLKCFKFSYCMSSIQSHLSCKRMRFFKLMQNYNNISEVLSESGFNDIWALLKTFRTSQSLRLVLMDKPYSMSYLSVPLLKQCSILSF